MFSALHALFLAAAVCVEAPPTVHDPRERLERYVRVLSPMRDELKTVMKKLEAKRDGYADRDRFKALSADREELRGLAAELRTRFDPMTHELDTIRRDNELAAAGAGLRDFLRSSGTSTEFWSQVALSDRIIKFGGQNHELSQAVAKALDDEEDAYYAAMDKERLRRRILWGGSAMGGLFAAAILFVWRKASKPPLGQLSSRGRSPMGILLMLALFASDPDSDPARQFRTDERGRAPQRSCSWASSTTRGAEPIGPQG